MNNVLALVLDRLQKYGPAYASLGAGAAGLTHLIATSRQKNEEKSPDENVVYLDIPKTANIFETPSASQYMMDLPIAAGTAMASGAVGYTIVDTILKKLRKSRMEADLENKKKEYSTLLTQKIMKSASEEYSYPTIEGLIASAVDMIQNEPLEKSAAEQVKNAVADPTTLSMITSTPGLGALLAGILAHNYWYGRQKDIQNAIMKQESETVKRTPAQIKLRSVDPEQEEDKMAGIMDGGFLDNISTAHSLKEIVEGEKTPESSKASFARKKVFSPSDVQQIDDNTVVVRTDDGETQIDASDPESVALLEKYKEVIAKSLALGANLNRAPVEA